ncbi:MAG: acylphosphatase [Elusimicrobiales bacterium]
MDRFLLKIYGRVQGIGYRWFVVEQAIKYNLLGWVKNCDDGSVECAVKGLRENIEKFIVDIKTKHPIARVEKIEINDCPSTVEFPQNFCIKR